LYIEFPGLERAAFGRVAVVWIDVNSAQRVFSAALSVTLRLGGEELFTAEAQRAAEINSLRLYGWARYSAAQFD
jgi:hypothetical protein